MPDQPDLATVESVFFEPLLHEKFIAQSWDVSSGQPPSELELVRVAPDHLGGPEGMRAPFSLFFDGPAAVSLEQGTYSLTHPRTSEMALFLVPVARRNDRIQLQAVFN